MRLLDAPGPGGLIVQNNKMIIEIDDPNDIDMDGLPDIVSLAEPAAAAQAHTRSQSFSNWEIAGDGTVRAWSAIDGGNNATVGLEVDA